MEDFSWNSSYVYALDNESLWTGRCFFTYFLQVEEYSFQLRTIELSIYVLIFLVSFIANTSIMICVIRYPDMRNVTNCFVLNLAAADLIFVCTIPAVAYTRFSTSWKLGNAACKIIPYIQFVSGIVLLWTLALISVDRHRCIVVPPYRSNITPRQTSIFSLAIWLTTSLGFIPVPLWFHQIRILQSKQVCTLIFPQHYNIPFSAIFVVHVVVFACLVPMLLLVYNYQRIFHKILSTRSTWASACVRSESVRGRRQSELSISDIFVPWPRRFSSLSGSTTLTSRQGSLSQQEEIRLNKHVRVVRVLFLNVIVVLVMWLPITVVMLLIYIDGNRAQPKGFFLRSNHFICALVLAYLNTVVNPILYGVLSDNFRACLKRLWCGSRWRQDVVEPTPTTSARNALGRRRPSCISSVSEN